MQRVASKKIATVARRPDDELDSLEDFDPFEGDRVSTGIASVDAIFGKNFITGDVGIHFPSTILWSGEPGLGKTTLLLQILEHVLRTTDRRCAFASAEMKGRAIRGMSQRLGLDATLRKMKTIVTDDFDEMLAKVRKARTQLVILDSLSEITRKDDNPGNEFTNQDEMMKVLLDDAAADPENYRAWIIVSHLNSDNKITGRRKTQHKCDTIAMLTDAGGGKIMLENGKSRLGRKGMRAFFRMDPDNGRMIELPQLAPLPPVESGALEPIPVTTQVATPVDIAVTIAAPITASTAEPDEFDEPQTPMSDPRFEGLLASSAARRKASLA